MILTCQYTLHTGRPSGHVQNRIEEKKLLETLHEEGLIERHSAVTAIGRQSAYGISFEVMAGDSESFLVRKPPPRLARLELERKKKKKRILTEEEIQEKLVRAQQRKQVSISI